MSTNYWQQNYNTPLSAGNEARFQNWMAMQSKARGRDMSGDLENYDLKGYWVGGGYGDTGKGHMPDTYKKPNHVCKDGNEVDPGWCIDFVPHVRRAAAYATMLQTLKDARDVLVVDARRFGLGLLPRGLAWDASAKLISQINEAIRKGDESDES